MFTELIYRTTNLRKGIIPETERDTAFAAIRASKKDLRSIRRRYWTGLSRVNYLPVKGLLHDIAWDPLWWHKIGPALD